MKHIELSALKLIVYDFDGVLTDNRVLVFQDGTEAVFCNRSDGLAIEMIRKLGIPQMILSKETNPVVKSRAKKLKIECLHGIDDKKTILIEYCKEHEIPLGNVLYIGNEINDIEVMEVVGYPVAPQDAHEKTLKVAKYVVRKNGGDGVVRELIETILVE